MTEKDWEKLLRIKTTGRDDSRSDTYRYPYEPTSYEVLNKLATPESSARTILCLIMAVGKDESVFSWLTKPNVTLLA